MPITFVKNFCAVILGIAVISFGRQVAFMFPLFWRDYSFVLFLFGGLTAGILLYSNRWYWGLSVCMAYIVYDKFSTYITLQSISTANELKPLSLLDYLLMTFGFVTSPIYGESGFKISILIKELILPICFSLIGCEVGYLLRKKFTIENNK